MKAVPTIWVSWFVQACYENIVFINLHTTVKDCKSVHYSTVLRAFIPNRKKKLPRNNPRTLANFHKNDGSWCVARHFAFELCLSKKMMHMSPPWVGKMMGKMIWIKVTGYLCFKIRPLLHISFNNYVARPSFKNLRGVFLTKWPSMSKVSELKLKVSPKKKPKKKPQQTRP